MSLANTIQLLTTRVAQEFNSVRAEIANTANNVYTRFDVDTALSTKADIFYVDTAVSAKADTSYVDNALSSKADTSYVDNALMSKIDSTYVDNALTSKADTSYVDNALTSKADTSYVDNALLSKADSADVYTISQTDQAISSALVNLLANDVYTKLETDSAITAGIASVVNTAPAALDTLRELASALNDDASFATTITTSIGLKANTSDVTTALGLKADQATTYTKTEVDNLLSPITGELSDLGSINLVALFEATLT